MPGNCAFPLADLDTRLELEVGAWFGIPDVVLASRVQTYTPASFVTEYFTPSEEVAWLRKFDFVMIGPCSLLLEMMRGHSYLEGAPFGKEPDLTTCIVGASLGALQDGSTHDIEHGLVIPRCCGRYAPEIIESVRNLYRQINWEVLDIELHDFQNDADVPNLIEHMQRLNLISLTNR